MDNKGRITISKVQDFDDEYVNLTIVDEKSRIQFLRAKINLRDFAEAIFGLGYVPIEFNVDGLDKVGKDREVKPLEFIMPGNLYGDDRREIARKIALEKVDEGWQPGLGFHSQDSFTPIFGKGEEKDTYLVKTYQYRYI